MEKWSWPCLIVLLTKHAAIEKSWERLLRKTKSNNSGAIDVYPPIFRGKARILRSWWSRLERLGCHSWKADAWAYLPGEANPKLKLSQAVDVESRTEGKAEVCPQR